MPKKSLPLNIFFFVFISSLILFSSAAAQTDTEMDTYKNIPYQGETVTVTPADNGVIERATKWLFGRVVNAVFDLPEDKQNLGKFVGDSVGLLEVAVGAQLVGDDCLEVIGEEGRDCFPQPGEETAGGGMVGVMSYAIGTVLSNPPNLHTRDYIKETLANNILNPTPAYAQTSGQLMLAPIRVVWFWARNASYTFFLIIFIITGFLIMLRYKLDPRTTISFFTSIPYIVIGLILITFSYAIAALIFDFGTLIHGVFTAMLNDIFTQTVPSYKQLMAISPFQIYNNIIKSINLSNVYTGGSFLFSLGILLIIWITGIFISFQIFYMLIKRYAQLFLRVMFAPFFFMWGSLPGQRDHIARWFKGILVDVMVFPVTYFILNLAWYIAILSKQAQFQIPPGLGSYGPAARNMGGLVAFALLMLVTKLPDVMEDALKVTPSPPLRQLGADLSQAARKVPLIGRLVG